MATFLLILIYFIYVGLGIPDSTVGSAWPSIYTELNLPISYANFVTVLISLFTIVASMTSARFINKFGTGLVTAVSTFLSALALLGFALSSSIVAFCLLAIPLGLGAGAIDNALNSYVAVRYNSVHMSFLHCFYGVGVSISPVIFSLAIKNASWRVGYKTLFIFQMVLVIIAFCSLPLWNKIKRKEIEMDNEIIPVTLSLKTMAKNSAIRTGWLVFFLTVGLEFTCGTWANAYFVNTLHLAKDSSALILSLYYIGITSGRFVSGLLATRLNSKKIIFAGYSVIALGILVFFLPIPPMIKGSGLFLIGFGNGPAFPHLSHLTPKFFGKNNSQSIMGTQMAVSNFGILVVPPIFGFIAEFLGTDFLPCFLALLLVLLVIFTVSYLKKAKNNPLNPLEKIKE